MARKLFRLLVVLILVLSYMGVKPAPVLAIFSTDSDLPPVSQEDLGWVPPAEWDVAPAASAQILPPDPQEGQPDPAFLEKGEFEQDVDMEPKADRTVGPGCTYATIAAAITAANPGDRLLLAGNVTFTEHLLVNKNIIIQGGYSGCASGSTARSIVDGSSTNLVFDINAATVTLQNLTIQNGHTTSEGGGIRFGYSLAGILTLTNSEVKNNSALWGGGVWIGDNSQLLASSSSIHNNTATSYGGGLRLFGATAILETSSVYSNTAIYGAGIYGSFGNVHEAALTLNMNSYVYSNTASGVGRGGGIYFSQGTVTVESDSDIYSNHAVQGGGVFLNVATFSISDISTTVDNNDSTGDGGGIYATAGSIVYLADGLKIFNNSASLNGGGIFLDNSDVVMVGGVPEICSNSAEGVGGGVYLGNGSTLTASGGRIGCSAYSDGGNSAVDGAGIYADISAIDFEGFIQNNKAEYRGGAILASGGTLSLNNTLVGGSGTDEANWLTSDLGYNGPGIYLISGATATLDAVTVSNNKWTSTASSYGGGLYILDSSATLQNGTLVENHTATSTFDGRGAGIYINNSTLNLDASFVRGNTAQTGGGIRVFNNSIVNIRNGSSVDHNNATVSGGGLASGTNNSTLPDLNIENSTMQYNHSDGDGGAFYINVGTLDFSGWWDLRWNSAGGNGGALAVSGTGDADFVCGGASYLAVNSASLHGGAIYLANADTVALYATSGYRLNFNTNTAGGDGGGGYADAGGYFDVYGDLQMTSNAATGNGGLFYLGNSSKLWMDDYFNVRPQVWVNHAVNGGSIYASNATVTLDGVDFGGTSNGSYTSTGNGGAIYLVNSSLDAENCHFRNNRAAANGGAIYAVTSTLLVGTTFSSPLLPELDHPEPKATGCDPMSPCSAFYNNLADSNSDLIGNGGAVYVNGGGLTMRMTHLYNNQAVRGGAIFQTDATAASTLENSLIYNNTVTTSYGAGIRSENGTLSIQHVTVANNFGGAGFSSSATGSLVINSIAYGNESSLGFVGSFSPASACNLDESGNVGVIPIFSPFVSGANYHLLVNSPAIDACNSGLSKDLNNRTRPIGVRYDMGAFEGGYIPVYLPFIAR